MRIAKLASVACLVSFCVTQLAIAQNTTKQPIFERKSPTAQEVRSEELGGDDAEDGPSANGPSGNGPGGMAANAKARMSVEARIKRQHLRLQQGIQQGTISKDQAKKFKATLDELEARVDTQKKANGGKLKPEQLKDAETKLNENFHLMRSTVNAGTHGVENGKVLGPSWSTGKDGAQNSGKLLHQMKQEEKRELRQEEQAHAQTLENQELDYEKQMMNKFGKQRKGILKQKQDLDQTRQESGAN